MLIDQIRDSMNQARQGNDTVARGLWVTLYAEASRVGKDKRNGDTTDEEALAVVRRFLANAEETRGHLTSRGQPALAQDREIEILHTLLPPQMTEEHLVAVIKGIVATVPYRGGKALGEVMRILKATHPGQYDSAQASRIARGLVS